MRASSELSSKVDLVKVLQRTWGIESLAAERLIADGHVEIDHHVVKPEWAQGHWTVDQLYGRLLYCHQRGWVRLYGSRLADTA